MRNQVFLYHIVPSKMHRSYFLCHHAMYTCIHISILLADCINKYFWYVAHCLCVFILSIHNTECDTKRNTATQLLICRASLLQKILSFFPPVGFSPIMRDVHSTMWYRPTQCLHTYRVTQTHMMSKRIGPLFDPHHPFSRVL